MPISVFNTYYMAGMIQEIVLPQTFFHDRYFSTMPGVDIFAADKVLVEYRDGDRKMAPFVVRRAGDIPIARTGYEIHEFEPPYIAPSRLLTLDDLQKRGFGEALFSGSTPAERARALQIQDLSDLSRRIQRREEWMSVQTMINNGCSMTAYIDNTTKGETYDVYYYDTTGSNPAIYTVSTKWDATGGDFMADVAAMAGDLLDRGLPATDLIVGTTVGQFIQSNEKIAKLLDNKRMEYGRIAPRVTNYPGVAWLGVLNFGGVDLDIYVVRETVVDENGTTQRLFPATSAMVTAPDCGHMMYGQVSQIEDDDQFHTFAMQRVPKFTVDKEHDIRKLRVAARPLAAPKQKAPWMYAKNVVG